MKDRVTIEIKQFSTYGATKFEGMWFVVEETYLYGYSKTKQRYLHPNLLWYSSMWMKPGSNGGILNENGQMFAYCRTKEKAEKRLEAWEQKEKENAEVR